MIPVQAVVSDAKGNTFVWIVNPETYRVSKRPVVTGGLAGEDIMITDGLKNKEWVVTSGVHYLHPDQKVKKYERED
jgi:multidrug efflux system membrane fusion protein